MITREEILEALNSYRTCNQETIIDVFQKDKNCDTGFGEVIDLAQHLMVELNDNANTRK